MRSESYGVQYLVLAHIFSSDRLDVRQILLPLVPLTGYIIYIYMIYWAGDYPAHAQTVPPQWGEGKRFDVSAKFFFYENGHNSETKSRKIDRKVGKEPSLQGLQTGR